MKVNKLPYKNSSMSRRMFIMLIGVAILFGGIFSYQIFKGHMIKKYMAANASPAVMVSTSKVESHPWQQKIKATGSLRAVQGVDVTTEIAGLVRKVQFTPGTSVKQGDLLVKLNTDTEEAQLLAYQALANLAKITYERDKAQFAANAVSKQTVDNDEANLKNFQAQVAQQKAVIAKKTIQAPFNGKLGIANVNEGQYVNPGDKIVTLQALDPIYVDFYVPQQALVQIAHGQSIAISIDTYPNQIFTGKITTINPKIDPATRNIEVEATVANPKQLLLPGMFATVEASTGKPQHYLTVPQTAISFNPYGEIAYIVKENGKDKKGNPVLTATQILVKVGETRGDQVAVKAGLTEGDIVVTSGQLKLKNGSHVAINNTVVPHNNPAPSPIDE